MYDNYSVLSLKIINETIFLFMMHWNGNFTESVKKSNKFVRWTGDIHWHFNCHLMRTLFAMGWRHCIYILQEHTDWPVWSLIVVKCLKYFSQHLINSITYSVMSLESMHTHYILVIGAWSKLLVQCVTAVVPTIFMYTPKLM